jgi:hypothetical protein
LQRKLLESEGVEFDGGTIDMKQFGWSPVRKKTTPKTRKRARPR